MAYRWTRFPLDAWRVKHSSRMALRLTAPLWRALTFVLYRVYGKDRVDRLAYGWQYYTPGGREKR